MTITVTQLNNYIRGVLDIDGILNDLSVCGEVTNVKRAREGWYFSLKDENAAIDCFCYGDSFALQAGVMAVAEGKINYWQKSGRISLFARSLKPTGDNGDAYLRFLQIKEKLQREGLFDESRKKTVPACCKKIGVVTSETGAVIHDIENVALRRQPFSEILLYTVKVQGAGADVEIAQGIDYFSQSDVDVVIVGRGGGSNEDLSAFNSETVVRAVATCNKPTVSAVGHGVDFTLCDFAADKRAVTPSEAAEFVTMDCAAVKLVVAAKLQNMQLRVNRQLDSCKTDAETSAKHIGSMVSNRVKSTLEKTSFNILTQSERVRYLVEQRRLRTEKTLDRLNAANPTNVLKRGFAYVTSNGKKVATVSSLKQGEKVTVRLYDGVFGATVTDTRKD